MSAPANLLYREILTHLSQGIVVQDADGQITLANAAAEHILGLSTDQMQGRTSLDPRWRAIRADGSDYPGDTHPAMRTLASGQAISGDIMGIRKPDGSLTWIEIDTAPVFAGETGKPDSVISLFSDITARREVETRLRDSETLFARLAEHIDVILWIVTPDWRHFDYISPIYEEVWQRRSADLYTNGMDWFESVLEEDRPAIVELLEKGYTDGTESIAYPPYRIKRPDGTIRWISARGFPIRDPEGRIKRIAGVAEDITERHLRTLQLEEMAHLDTLTRLPNRVLLADRMHQALARSRRTGALLAVCMFDLDGFKPINDQYGHKAGDQLLVQLAGRLLDAIRGDDTVARLGGDEFVLLLGGIRSLIETEEILTRVLGVVSQPFNIQGHQVRVTASIGVTLFPDDGNDADTLLRHADHAMYLAKQAGKARYQIFNPAIEIRERENAEAMKRIGKALRKKQFCLFYQPIVDCRRGEAVGVEALIRWDHPTLGLLAPSEFLPLVERDAALTEEIGRWVLEEAIRQADAWWRTGLNLNVNVNVFPQQFRALNFQQQLSDLLAAHPSLPPDRLSLEVIESSALEDIVSANRTIQNCRSLGVRFSLDDFGTGYSSLTYLKRLPVNTLKVDRSFIRDMLQDPEDTTIVEAIIGLGTAFRHRIIAEGVETLEQILILMEMGCHLIQGYVIAHPMRAASLEEWLGAFKPDPRWHMNAAQHISRDDFQLIIAEVHHRQWHMQVTAWLTGEPGARGAPPPLDERACNFGRWYLSEPAQRYRHLAEFAEAGRAHEHIHSLACALVAAASPGAASETARVTRSDLQDASDQFINTLIRLRQTVGRRHGQEGVTS